MTIKQQIEDIENSLYYIREDMDSDSTSQSAEQLEAAQEALKPLESAMEDLSLALFS